MASPRVALTCNHEVDYDPPANVGDEVYCRRCGTWRLVNREIDGLIRANCRMCPYTRYYGTDENEAYRRGGDHVNRFPSHEVDIEKDRKLIHTILIPSSMLISEFPHPSDSELTYGAETLM